MRREEYTKKWHQVYRDCMYRSRTPGWLVAVVMVSHMSCCPKVWVPCVQSASTSASKIFSSWPAFSATTKTSSAAAPEPSTPEHAANDDDDESSSSAALPKSRMVLSSESMIFKDPMTIVFDLFEYLLEKNPQPSRPAEESAKLIPGELEEDERICSSSDSRSSREFKDDSTADGSTIHQHHHRDLWVLLIIPCIAFASLWLPSTYTVTPMSGKSCSWSMGSSWVACITSSLAICHALWFFLPQARATAVCLAMHLSSHHIFSAWSVCGVCSASGVGSPLNVVGGSSQIPNAVCSLAMGALIFHISHQHDDGSTALTRYGQLQFYSSHVWSLVIVEAVRAFVYAPVLNILLY